MSDDLRYPIGKFTMPDPVTDQRLAEWRQQFAAGPANLRAAIRGLTDAQLDTPYRPGGWTVRQVVHHLPDSHANGYVRFRMALTEDSLVVKTYDEAAWAELSDGKGAEVEPSLQLYEALHRRWGLLLEAMGAADWKRPLHHPEVGQLTLDVYFSSYAWHAEHHVAHITRLREREAWD